MQEKLKRIADGKPGSPCTEKHLASNTEFTKAPICTASHKYQSLKIAQLESLNLTEEEHKKQLTHVLAKECLCVGLSNSASIEYKQPFLKKLNSVIICPGPNIAYFSEVVTLRKMIDHIYGRVDLLDNIDRPHMFINELRLYIAYLKEQLVEGQQDEKHMLYCTKFASNILDGIAYYKAISVLIENTCSFRIDLESGEAEINNLFSNAFPYSQLVKEGA